MRRRLPWATTLLPLTLTFLERFLCIFSFISLAFAFESQELAAPNTTISLNTALPMAPTYKLSSRPSGDAVTRTRRQTSVETASSPSRPPNDKGTRFVGIASSASVTLGTAKSFNITTLDMKAWIDRFGQKMDKEHAKPVENSDKSVPKLREKQRRQLHESRKTIAHFDNASAKRVNMDKFITSAKIDADTVNGKVQQRNLELKPNRVAWVDLDEQMPSKNSTTTTDALAPLVQQRDWRTQSAGAAKGGEGFAGTHTTPLLSLHHASNFDGFEWKDVAGRAEHPRKRRKPVTRKGAGLRGKKAENVRKLKWRHFVPNPSFKKFGWMSVEEQVAGGEKPQARTRPPAFHDTFGVLRVDTVSPTKDHDTTDRTPKRPDARSRSAQTDESSGPSALVPPLRSGVSGGVVVETIPTHPTRRLSALPKSKTQTTPEREHEPASANKQRIAKHPQATTPIATQASTAPSLLADIFQFGNIKNFIFGRERHILSAILFERTPPEYKRYRITQVLRAMNGFTSEQVDEFWQRFHDFHALKTMLILHNDALKTYGYPELQNEHIYELNMPLQTKLGYLNRQLRRILTPVDYLAFVRKQHRLLAILKEQKQTSTNV